MHNFPAHGKRLFASGSEIVDPLVLREVRLQVELVSGHPSKSSRSPATNENLDTAGGFAAQVRFASVLHDHGYRWRRTGPARSGGGGTVLWRRWVIGIWTGSALWPGGVGTVGLCGRGVWAIRRS